MNPWLRRSIIAALALLTTGMLGAYAFLSTKHGEIEDGYEKHRESFAHTLDTHTAAFLADQKRLSSKPWATNGPCRSDAGSWLNPGIPWSDDPQDADTAKKDALADWAAIMTQHETLNKLHEGDSPWWTTPKSALDTSTLDLSWMARLANHDCWDVNDSGPRKDFTPSSTDDLFALSLPLYTNLMAAGKLRILQGVQQGEAAQALKETHDLGRLLLTTENTIGVTIGELLLISVSKVVSALEREGVSLSEVPRWDDEDIAALERMSPFTWTAYVSIMTPARHRATIEEDFSDAPGVQAYGRCAGINESLQTSLMVRGLLDEDAFVWMDGVLERSPCRLKLLRRIWHNPVLRLENESRAFCKARGPAEDCPYPAPKWLPTKIKESLGMVLITIAQFNTFSGYEDP